MKTFQQMVAENERLARLRLPPVWSQQTVMEAAGIDYDQEAGHILQEELVDFLPLVAYGELMRLLDLNLSSSSNPTWRVIG